jgi:hypothetical protein
VKEAMDGMKNWVASRIPSGKYFQYQPEGAISHLGWLDRKNQVAGLLIEMHLKFCNDGETA